MSQAPSSSAADIPEEGSSCSAPLSSLVESQGLVRGFNHEFSITKNLRKLMYHKNVNDTKTLVEAYNTATSDDEKNMWLDCFFSYVRWFDNLASIPEAHQCTEYLELGNAKYVSGNPRMNEFWIKWFNSIIRKIEVSPESVEAGETMEISLHRVPSAVFVGNLSPLTSAANRLVELLSPSKEALVKENYEILRHRLISLHQIFVLMQQVAKNFLDANQQLYKETVAKLRKIKQEQRYYPIYFLTEVIEESISELERNRMQSTMTRWLGICYSSVKVVINVSNVVAKAAKLEVDLESIEAAISNAKHVVDSCGAWKRKWRAQVNHLSFLALKCCHDLAVFDEFCIEAENLLQEYPFGYYDTNVAKAIRFSIIEQLKLIACKAKEPDMQQKSIDWLLCVGSKCEKNDWSHDLDVYEAILDALGVLYVVVEEKSLIVTVLLIMKNIEKTHINNRYESWLGAQTLDDKLLTFESLHYVASSKNVIFTVVKEEMEVCTSSEVKDFKETLKRFYSSEKFAKVDSIFDEEKANKLVDAIFELAKDSDEGVRWTASRSIGEVAKANPQTVNKLVDVVAELAKDSHKDVCRAALKSITEMAKTTPETTSKLVTVVVDLTNDSNWRVRQVASQCIGEIAKTNPEVANKLVDVIVELAKDSNNDVCAAALKSIGEMAAMNSEIANKLVNVVIELATNSYWGIRWIASKSISKMTKTNPKMASKLVNVIVELAKDSNEHVRLTASNSIGEIVKANPEVTNKLVDVVAELAEDSDWIIREATLKTIGEIINKRPEMATKLLDQTCAILISNEDHVTRELLHSTETILSLMATNHACHSVIASNMMSKFKENDILDNVKCARVMRKISFTILFRLVMNGNQKAIGFCAYKLLVDKVAYEIQDDYENAMLRDIGQWGSEEWEESKHQVATFVEEVNAYLDKEFPL